MCRFALSGGSGERQKISQYLVWPAFASRSATYFLHIQLIRLLFAVRGMLVHSFSMADQSWWILAGIWKMLLYTLIQSIPNMLSGSHVWWVCWPYKNWDVFSFQELCTDPSYMGLWMIMLNMRWWSWKNRTTMGLRILSRYACAFNMLSKKSTGVWSITYSCPYHNSTATTGHLI